MTETPEQIISRGICESQGQDMDTLGQKDIHRRTYTEAAQAAIAALKEAGFVIVPVEPTRSMLEATRFSPAMQVVMTAKYKQMVRAAIKAGK